MLPGVIPEDIRDHVANVIRGNEIAVIISQQVQPLVAAISILIDVGGQNVARINKNYLSITQAPFPMHIFETHAHNYHNENKVFHVHLPKNIIWERNRRYNIPAFTISENFI